MHYGCRAVRASFHLVHLLVEQVDSRATLISCVQSRAFGEVGHRFLETVAVISGRAFGLCFRAWIQLLLPCRLFLLPFPCVMLMELVGSFSLFYGASGLLVYAVEFVVSILLVVVWVCLALRFIGAPFM